MKPIIRWPGGKRKHIDFLKHFIPPGKLYEPFAGGLAVSLALKPKGVWLNDIDPALINFYRHVAAAPEQLKEKFSTLPIAESVFYEIRGQDITRGLQGAVNFMYLNAFCYSGGARRNQSGQFNSPFQHDRDRVHWDTYWPNFFRVSKWLAGVKLTCGEFDVVTPGYFVYMDPPYDDTLANYVQNYSNFNLRLWKYCDRLTVENIQWLMSNQDTPLIRKLFCRYKIREIKTKHSIKKNANQEVLISNENILSGAGTSE